MDLIGNLKRLLGIQDENPQASAPTPRSEPIDYAGRQAYYRSIGRTVPNDAPQTQRTEPQSYRSPILGSQISQLGIYSPGEGPQTNFMPPQPQSIQQIDPLQEAMTALYRSPIVGSQAPSRGIYSPGEGPRTRF